MLKKAYDKISVYCDTRVNPVVLKELRQSFNTKGLIWGMVFLLLIMVVITGVIIFSARNPQSISGMDLFVTFFVIMALCCCFSIIPMGGYRHNKEVFGEQLFNMSGLSPRQLLNGKLASMLIEVGLIIFLTVPFMAMAYMFQGLMPQTIFQVIFLFILTVSMLTLLYLCMGSLRVKQMSGLVLVGSLVAGPIMAGVIMDFGRHWNTPREIIFLDCAMLLFALKYAIFLYTASYVLLSPPSWNRATPLRLVIAVLCLIQGVPLIILSLPFCQQFCSHELKSLLQGAMIEWFVTFFFFALIQLFCAIFFHEQTRQSRRIHKTIPRNRIGRILYFPFFPGEANGISFSLAMGAFLIPGVYAIAHNFKTTSTDFTGVMIFFLVPFFYFLAAYVLSMVKLPLNKETRFISALLTLAIGINAIPIYYFFKERQAELWNSPFHPLMSYSYLGLDRRSFNHHQIIILCGTILILTVFLRPSFVRSFKRFHRLDEAENDNKDYKYPQNTVPAEPEIDF